ncbi:hypothetical protein E8E12_000359 [Didymella heteroderae]|uniref:Subtelomeric hrmA-associated cluster protein AFUB-079030/YDR124W-like helical bundle domain-containing protein n=1 Tax=Didymella heteroderae TaxID=1769908 RepID=A0A9P5BTT2_9PLEO|nr:hypothetical protein E8E12_000359 [Didymella heteroderae]
MKNSKFKGRKRTRSVTPDLAGNEDNSSEGDGQTVEVATEKSHTFYIGDIDSLKKFLTHRFDELTLEELRGFVRHWIKLIERRWIGDWGMYHEMKVSEAETPPWWPQDMIYREPSHLKKEELTLLAVQVMLIHRKVDDVKRKSQWISKPRDVANFMVQTISADDFSSPEGAAHSGEMQKRALEETLSSTFGIAQAHKTHNVQSNLTEGASNKDPGRGTHHTWNPIPNSIIGQQSKRTRRIAHPKRVQKNVDEASGDETEPDDTMTNRYLQKVLDMKPHL